MKLQLPSDTATEQDLDSLIMDIRRYGSWYAQNTIKKRLKVRRETTKPNISEEAQELIHDWSIQQPLSSDSLSQLVSSLEDFKKDAPKLTVILAAPAPTKLKRDLVSWFRKNVSDNILVNFQINSNILGGLVVRYGSHIYDWSFKQQILAAQDNFPGVLKSV